MLHQGSPIEIASMLLQRRGRHRHRHRSAAGCAVSDDLPILHLASRRDRAEGPRAGEAAAADARGDRGVADRHLPRGLHRPRAISTQVCQAPGWRPTSSCRRWIRTCSRPMWSSASASASSRPWPSIPKRDVGLQLLDARAPVRGQHVAHRRAQGQLSAQLRLPLHRAVLARAARSKGARGRARRPDAKVEAASMRVRRLADHPSRAAGNTFSRDGRQAHRLTRLQARGRRGAGASSPPRSAAARRGRWCRSCRSAPTRAVAPLEQNAVDLGREPLRSIAGRRMSSSCGRAKATTSSPSRASALGDAEASSPTRRCSLRCGPLKRFTAPRKL